MRFVSVDPRRRLFAHDARGRRKEITLGLDAPMLWGTWTEASSARSTWSWPTWSPDGRRVACFRAPQSGGTGAVVQVLDVDGTEAAEVAELGPRLPIYLHWAPTGSARDQRLAVVSQLEDKLHLSVVDPREAGSERRLAEGSPLFFTWADAGRVAAFVGGATPASSRMTLLDAVGQRAAVVLPGVPANFCAPLAHGDDVVYVTLSGNGEETIVVGRPGSAELRTIEAVEGLVALVPAPGGTRRITRAIAPGGDGTPYRKIALIDVETGSIEPVAERPCLAFLWAGERLLLARVDTERNLLAWHVVEKDGTSRPLVDVHPTRDVGFFLRFFEQYAQSHRLVDPSGRYLLLAGGVAGKPDPHGVPRLWRVDVDTGVVEEVGEGVFAVWSPE